MDPARPDPGPIVGIDLGTTYSLVAIADDAGPRVLRADDGSALLPSVVRYEAGAVVVGERARSESDRLPRATVSSVKRLMGRGLTDAAGDVPFLPYRVVEDEHRTARVELEIGGARVVVSPQEVSAEILGELRRRASRALGVEVRRAVVTVPAYFDDAQRQATRDAGRIAGLEVLRIVNEPTAAALAYGLGAPTNRPMMLVVFDLGGGTFDVTVLRRIPPSDDAGMEFFQVLATAGDTRLGGDDVDRLLVDLVLRELGGDVGPADLARALRACERAKRELSQAESTTIRFECMGAPVVRPIARHELEALIEPWISRAMACTRRAMADAARRAGATPSIDAVILVGGSTRIPLVRRRVAEAFGIEPYTAIDPDEAVALGAAVQARILAGDQKDMLLLDVVPLSLGVETVGGAVAKLVMRNSTLPCRAIERFSTSVDGQTSIRLSVFQGEREMAADCRKLGEFHLRGLPPMPAGIPRVEVEFLVDASGILSVSAAERRSGKRAALQVVPSHGLSREEVDRLERESVRFAREDMARHRVVDLVANARLDLKWIGERFERYRAKLEPHEAADLAPRIERLAELVRRAEADWTSVDPDAMHREKEELDRASVRLQEIGIAESLREEEGRA